MLFQLFQLFQLFISPARALNLAAGGAHLRVLIVIYFFILVLLFRRFMNYRLAFCLRTSSLLKTASAMISAYILSAVGFFLVAYTLCSTKSC